MTLALLISYPTLYYATFLRREGKQRGIVSLILTIVVIQHRQATHIHQVSSLEERCRSFWWSRDHRRPIGSAIDWTEWRQYLSDVRQDYTNDKCESDVYEICLVYIPFD